MLKCISQGLRGAVVVLVHAVHVLVIGKMPQKATGRGWGGADSAVAAATAPVAVAAAPGGPLKAALQPVTINSLNT